jgi:hypothetical protein
MALLLLFVGSAGCTTTLVRTAKVRKGASIDLAGMALHYFDPDNLGNHVSLILAASYFYARGDYIFLNMFGGDTEVATNTLNVSLGIDFHWGAPPPMPDMLPEVPPRS